MEIREITVNDTEELYEKQGFHAEGRREKSMNVNGKLINEYYMAKILC